MIFCMTNDDYGALFHVIYYDREQKGGTNMNGGIYFSFFRVVDYMAFKMTILLDFI